MSSANEDPDEVKEGVGESSKVKDGVPIDEGWAWMVAIGAFVLFLLVSGHGVALSVLLLDIVDHYNTSLPMFTIMMSLNYLAYSLACGFSTNVLLSLYSVRKICLGSAVTNSLSTLMMAWAPGMPCFMVLHFIKYACYGAVFAPALTLVGHYFKRRRSLVSSLVLLGLSIAAILFPALVASWKRHYGFQGCFVFLSGMEAHGITAAALLRPLSFYPKSKYSKACLNAQSEHETRQTKDKTPRTISKVIISSASLTGQSSDSLNTEYRGLYSEKDTCSHCNGEESKSRSCETHDRESSEKADYSSGKEPYAHLKLGSYEFFDGQNYRTPEVEHLMATEKEYVEMPDALKHPHAPGVAKYGQDNLLHSLLTRLVSEKYGQPKCSSLWDMSALTREDGVCYKEDDSCRCSDGISLRDRSLSASRRSMASTFMSSLMSISMPYIIPEDDATDPEAEHETRGTRKTVKELFHSCSCSGIVTAFLDVHALKSLSGFLFLTSYVLARSGFFITTYLPAFASGEGLDKNQSAILLVIYGVVDMLSRILFGYLGDLHLIRPKYIIATTTLLSGVLVLFAKLYTTFPLLVCFSSMFGLLGCVSLSLNTNNIIDIQGLDKLGRFLALSCQGLNLSYLLQFPIVAVLIQATGQLLSVFYYVAGCYLLSTLLLIVHTCISRSGTDITV